VTIRCTILQDKNKRLAVPVKKRTSHFTSNIPNTVL